jgi:formylmethanofuran dehydrogenase subunit D
MLEVTLITGRTISQGEVIDEKYSESYAREAAICELSKEDMEKLGIGEGEVIKVITEEGEVCVYAKSSNLSKGLAFIPLGPWANALIPTGTDSTGMPSFKGIKARIELAKGEKVLQAEELIGRYL